ncbi:Leucine-rich repeat neuronal protein 3 [Halotydeus destructor]|nr:Leucine-rich repeat neuronal protein 3 [Halotydeus destructor]
MMKFTTFLVTVTLLSIKCEAQNVTCRPDCVCGHVNSLAPEVINGSLVDCRQVRMKEFPSAMQLPLDIYKLDLSMNEIKTLSSTDTMDSLKVLDLEGNSLAIIDPGALDKLTNLVELRLGYNNLTDIPNELLVELTELRILTLNQNHLQHIHEDMFKANLKLEQLTLRDNPLVHIDASWFKFMNSLVKLDLANTKVFAMSIETFHYAHNLKELDLSENEFTKVPIETLRGIKNLKTLRFNKNPVKYLNQESFTKLSTLEELEVCEMSDLLDILPMTFSDLVNLKKLTVAQNPHLTYIDRLAFYGMFNGSYLKLKEVDLKGNRLRALSQNSLRWCDLDNVDLRENPWNCECHLNWLPDCAPVVRGPRCAEPEDYRGLEVHSLESHDFKCPHHLMGESARVFRIFVILFGSVIIFFTGLGLVLFFKRTDIVRWYSEKKRGTGSIYYMKANSIPGESQTDLS